MSDESPTAPSTQYLLRGQAGIAILGLQQIKRDGGQVLGQDMAAFLVRTMDALLGEIDDLRAQLAVARGGEATDVG